MLVSTSADGGVIVWDADTGAELHRLVGHAGEIGDAVFAPDDRTLYTTDTDEVMAWDVTGKDALLSPGEATTPVVGQLDLSLPAPDGRTIARVAGQRLWFVDDRDGRETARSRTDRTVWSHGWSPDSERFFTVGPGVLTLWDPDTGRLVGERRYANGYGVVAAFSSDGDRVYVHDRFGNLETLDPAKLEPLYDAISVGDVAALVSHPTKGTVLGLKSDGSIIHVDPETGHMLASESGSIWTMTSVSTLAERCPRTGRCSPYTLRREACDCWTRTRSSGWASSHPSRSVGTSHSPRTEASWPPSSQAGFGCGTAGPAPTGPASRSPTQPPTLTCRTSPTAPVSSSRHWTEGRGPWTPARQSWVERACRIAGRNLTQDEWKQFFPNRPYEVTCRQWPAGT